MTLKLIIIMTTFMTITLPLMSQPLSFGLTLLISTLMLSILTGYLMSSWYAYMTFIVFVGGLLVMFACALTASACL